MLWIFETKYMSFFPENTSQKRNCTLNYNSNLAIAKKKGKKLY